MYGKLLSRWLGDREVVGHAVRAAALVRVVGALLVGGKLALTHLGRSLTGSARVKHQIKAVDRLLGNQHLHRERNDIYRALARTLLAGIRRPLIIVDWSDFELGREWLMLKAAVPVGGRAISLYERVFHFKRYNSPGAHREFLRDLHSILPEGCRPILVTDAGFRGPWFRAVEAHGWHWVGRIRNKIKYYRESTGRWSFTDSLYPEATTLIAGQRNPTRPCIDGFIALRGCWQPRCLTKARQRTANQADLHTAHADRENLSPPQEPPLAVRSALRAVQQREATRNPASTWHSGDARGAVGRSCWPRDAVELAAASQHDSKTPSALHLLHRTATPGAAFPCDTANNS